MANPKSSFFKLFGHINDQHKLSPRQLNQTTYVEIFRSNKNSIKKNLNFMNYTKHDHDVITNQRLSSAYSSFRGDMFNYSNSKQDRNYTTKRRFLNRSPPGSNTNKKFIRRNIHNIKHLTDMNNLKSLQRAELSPGRLDSFDINRRNMTTKGNLRSKSNAN